MNEIHLKAMVFHLEQKQKKQKKKKNNRKMTYKLYT